MWNLETNGHVLLHILDLMEVVVNNKTGRLLKSGQQTSLLSLLESICGGYYEATINL